MTNNLNQRHRRRELEFLLSTVEGRVFLWRTLEEDCKLLQEDFALNASAYCLLAKQEIGKRLLAEAKEVDPSAVYRAEQEYRELMRRSLCDNDNEQ